MLLTKVVEIIANTGTIGYLRKIGYVDIEIGDKVFVDVEKLPNSSCFEVEVYCDYCLENKVYTLLKQKFKQYKSANKTLQKDCCKKCTSKKKREIANKFNNGKYAFREPLYSDEFLLDKLKNYYYTVGFPTQREFVSKNNLPSYTIYYDRFGSFKNAILISGIPIPKDREQYFGREKLSDEELLYLLKYYTEEKLKTDIYLLTNDEIDLIDKMPTTNAYVNRFGGVISAYKRIGIDYYEFNKMALKKDLIKKYKSFEEYLGRTPTSRDLDKGSSAGICYSASAYTNHFGTMMELHKEMDSELTVSIGRNMDNDDALSRLVQLSKEIGRIPIQKDVDECDFTPSVSFYINRFNSFRNALIEAGFSKEEIKNKIFTTKFGNKCFSTYEYVFCKMLENNGYKFNKEVLYKNFIENFNKRYSFDFVINIDGENYFVEIFGITGNENYYKKTAEKIKICKDNNLKLVEVYPENLFGKQKDIKIWFDDYINRLKL